MDTNDVGKVILKAAAGAGAVVTTALGSAFALGCAFSAPGYRGPDSNHFDGKRFFNPADDPGSEPSFGAFVRWQLESERDRGVWGEYREMPPGPPPPERVTGGALRVTFVNHATVLLQMDGLNILTDPIWSERASPVSFAGPRRVRPPGLRFEDLPPVDVVLVSHNHYDHLDLPTLRQLAERHAPRIFTGLGNAQLMEEGGVGGAADLDWWQSVELAPGISLTAVPARHFSSRGTTDRNKTLWAGFVLQGPCGAVYFAGDTGFGDHFAQIRARFGPPRLAVLPIGAYRPRWLMAPVHMSPAEAVQAHLALAAATSVGIHFGTFQLADDGELEPPRELARELEARDLPADYFWALGFGEGRDVPAPGSPT